MIDLTPIDVRKKKGDFKRAVRGYDTDLVDDFLDLVAERLEELVKQNMALTDRLGRLEEQVGEYRQRDRALTEALVTAQEVREEVRRQAEKDAELVHREAEADATRIRAEAAAAREREEEALRRLRARRLQIIDSFRTFLERELTELAVTRDTLEREESEENARAAAQSRARAPERPARRTPRRHTEMDEPPVDEGARAPEAEAETPSPPAARPMPEAAAELELDDDPDRSAPPEPQEDAAEQEGPDWLSSIMDEK